MKDKTLLGLMMLATGGLAALALPFTCKKYTSPKERLQRRSERKQERQQARKESKRDDVRSKADKQPV